jgi:hypothetical protein
MCRKCILPLNLKGERNILGNPFVVYEADPEYYKEHPSEKVIPKFWMGEVVDIIDDSRFKFVFYDCENSNVEKKWRKLSFIEESRVEDVLYLEHNILTGQKKIRQQSRKKIESIIDDLQLYDDVCRINL